LHRRENVGNAIRISEGAVACEPDLEWREEPSLDSDNFGGRDGLIVAPPVRDPQEDAPQEEFGETGVALELSLGQPRDDIGVVDRESVRV
jgi:hypothetical protein